MFKVLGIYNFGRVTIQINNILPFENWEWHEKKRGHIRFREECFEVINIVYFLHFIPICSTNWIMLNDSTIGRWHGKSVHNFRIDKNNGNLILTFSSWLKSVGLLIATAVDYLL